MKSSAVISGPWLLEYWEGEVKRTDSSLSALLTDRLFGIGEGNAPEVADWWRKDPGDPAEIHGGAAMAELSDAPRFKKVWEKLKLCEAQYDALDGEQQSQYFWMKHQLQALWTMARVSGVAGINKHLHNPLQCSAIGTRSTMPVAVMDLASGRY